MVKIHHWKYQSYLQRLLTFVRKIHNMYGISFMESFKAFFKL